VLKWAFGHDWGLVFYSLVCFGLCQSFRKMGKDQNLKTPFPSNEVT
jgi:hypothetical protein